MSKRNDKNDGNGAPPLDQQVLTENAWTEDSAGDVWDEFGNAVPPGTVAGAMVVDEMDIPAAKRADGLDAMFSPPVGTPPAPFVRPGTAIDSDGLMGMPAEMQAQKPDPLESGEGESWIAGPGVSPPPGALAQARAAGVDLWSRLAPSGEALKGDHREAASGQYTFGPSHPPGTPPGPSHEVRQFDGNSDASMSRLIGSTRAPTPASVPTIRTIPSEESKGSSL